MLDADGTPLPPSTAASRSLTEPLRDRAQPSGPAPGSPTPHESLRVPAIGDIDGDREPEIVATAGEHVYAWEVDGNPVARLPGAASTRPLGARASAGPRSRASTPPTARSPPRTTSSAGSSARSRLADLDDDGRLDIVAGAIDQHVYAWDGDGDAAAGLPGEARERRRRRRRDRHLAGDRRARRRPAPPEIVIATNEVIAGDPPSFPARSFDALQRAARARRPGSNPVYARPRRRHPGRRLAGRRSRSPPATCCRSCCPATTPPILDARRDDGDDEVSVSAGTVDRRRAGRRSSTATARRISNYPDAAARTCTDPGPDPQPRRLPLDRRPRRHRQPARAQGRADAQRRGEPARRQPEPALQPRRSRPGTRRPAPPARLPARDRRLPARLAGRGRPGRRRRPRRPGARRHRPLPAARLRARPASRPTGWPKFTGGWTQATPAVGDADGDGDLDVSVTTREGWSFLWDTQRRCLRRLQRRVVELPPRRVRLRQLRHRRPPARDADGPRGDAATTAASTSAGRRRATTGSAARRRATEVLLSADPIDASLRRRSRARLQRRRGRVGGAVRRGRSTRRRHRRRPLRRRPLSRRRRQLGPPLLDAAAGHGVRTPGPQQSPGPPRPASPPMPRPAPPTTADGGPARSAIAGTDGVDRLVGSIGGERIVGQGGNDRISAGAGDDCVAGGGGNDRIKGDDGGDKLTGQKGNDRSTATMATTASAAATATTGSRAATATTGSRARAVATDLRRPGDDVLRAGQKPDRVSGGAGDDSIEIVGGGADVVNCGSGQGHGQGRAHRTGSRRTARNGTRAALRFAGAPLLDRCHGHPHRLPDRLDGDRHGQARLGARRE